MRNIFAPQKKFDNFGHWGKVRTAKLVEPWRNTAHLSRGSRVDLEQLVGVFGVVGVGNGNQLVVGLKNLLDKDPFRWLGPHFTAWWLKRRDVKRRQTIIEIIVTKKIAVLVFGTNCFFHFSIMLAIKHQLHQKGAVNGG